jgi:hypothetical protein
VLYNSSVLLPIVTVPNLTRSESTSIESMRGSKPDETGIDEYRLNEIRDLWTVIGLIDSHVTYKGIYIARSPSTILVP